MHRHTALHWLFGSTLLLLGISSAQATAVFGNPVNLGGAINSDATDAGATLSADGLTLYFQSDRANGSGQFDLYMATRTSTSSPWSAAVNMGTALNSIGNDRSPTVSADGLTLVFASDRNGNYNLFMSTRSSTLDLWGAPTGLGSIVNSPSEESGPSLSSDGLTLYFQTDRNNGNTNLFMTSRASLSDPWTTPVGLGPVVNSPDFDVAPDISADGQTLLFHSDRAGGPGVYNIWESDWDSLTSQWGTPYLLPGSVNSAGNALGPDLSSDGQFLFFASDRAGGIAGSRDIWMASVVPVPAAVWLFGSGLLGLIGIARRKA